MCTRIMHTLFTGTGLRIKCLILCITVISICMLTSCSFHTNSADIVVEYQIPFAKSGSRWNEIELLEDDEYGRKLYSYKSGKAHTNVFRDYMGINYMNAPVLMYIIVQKTEKDFVYCYDDLCYMYVKSFDDDNSDIISDFKEKNDWDESVEEKKLTTLSVDDFDDIVGYPIYSVEESAVTALEELIDCEIEDYYLDDIFLENSQPIFVLREVINREKHEFGKSFVFHVPDDSSKATYLELSDDIQNWNEEIHDFKATLTQMTQGDTGDGSLC